MIEWHVDLVADWWVIPIYLVGIFVLALSLMVAVTLLGRWLDR